MNNNMTSIIILSYNTLIMLQMCIESIRAFTELGTYEIIIVDNASKDGSAEWLKEQKDIHCIFNENNEGFPKGCNQGMEIARGEDILLLNSDTIVTPRWLENLKVALYSDRLVGAVGCVTNKCSNFQEVTVSYTEPLGAIEFGEWYNHNDSNKWQDVFKLVAFCMLIKREIYECIGGLDEQFSPGNYEDDDYSLRIKLLGYKLILCEDTYIHHFGSGSFVKKRTREEELEHIRKYNSLLFRNIDIFCSKWQTFPEYLSVCNVTKFIKNKLKDRERIMYIGANSMIDLMFLHRFNKKLRLEYITNNQLDWKTPREFIKQYNVSDIEREYKTALSGKYDAVVIDTCISKEKYVSKICSILTDYMEKENMIFLDGV